MFVNAILHQQVPIKDENRAKFPQGLCGGSILDVLLFEMAYLSGIKSRLMSELQPSSGTPPDSPQRKDPAGTAEPASVGEPVIFAAKPSEGARIPVAAWIVAGVVVLAVLVGLIIAGKRKAGPPGNTVQPLAAYAANLALSQLAMSESTSLSGGKSTFIDGHIQNTGNQTVTGITVQVLFRNDEAMPPQVETLPLALIRTREPYIDTQPVAGAPLKPGDERDFRLIFETIPANWNVQMPEIHIIEVTSK
jgi:hypothetical protein